MLCVCTLLHVKFWNTFNLCTPEFAHSCVVMTALLFRLNQKGRLAVYLVTYSLNRLLGADFLTISVCIFWMEGRALSSLRTMVTDQFTKKHCYIALILIKRKRNLLPKRKLK